MKTHYRKVFKSDHLSKYDLEDFKENGIRLVFTIQKVVSYYKDAKIKGSGVLVAGKVISANVAFFKEDIKPMVLNAGNSEIVRDFAGGSAYAEDWPSGILVELYIDSNVKMGGAIVGGIKVKPKQPTLKKPELNPESKSWESAKVHVKANKPSFEALNKNYSITKENYDLLCL
jgi:hypothetical protein